MITMTITIGNDMYTIYNTGDIVFRKPDGSTASVWTNDGLYADEYGMAPANWLTKLIVHATRLSVIAIDKFFKA
jgi:hypothetical protein